MTNNKNRNRLTGWLIAGGLILAAIGSWQFIKYHLIHKKLNSMVAEKTKGLYSIKYDSLLVDEVTGNLHVSNVELLPDTDVYNQMVEANTSPPLLLHITIPALEILRVKTPKALLNKEIDGGRIEVSRPLIEIFVNKFMKDTTGYTPDKDIYRQILGKLSGIKVDTIQVNQANIVVKDIRSKAVHFKGTDVSILMTGLLIDSAHQEDSSRILFSNSLDFHCAALEMPSTNKDYHYDFENLSFSSRKNSFFIGRIAMIPNLGEEDFAKAAKVQKDRYDISLENISLVNLDRESLWHKRIKADSLIVLKSSLKIYRDLGYPHDSLDRVGKYPQQELMRAPVPLLVKNIVFTHSFIEYKERNAKSREAGKVQFYDVQLKIDNVTNIHSLLAKNDRCIVDFRSKFLNRAPLQATLTFFPNNAQGKFLIKGSLGQIHTQYLNPLTEPMALAKLESGTIRNMNFDFAGDDLHCGGKLELLYDDLKISLLKKDKDDAGLSKKGLASFAANILIKNANPSPGEKPRIADTDFKRVRYKSIFNLLWKTIFSGVKESVGMK